MWGVLVIYVAAITSVLGHSDESALLQTKYIVHEHTAPQAIVATIHDNGPFYGATFPPSAVLDPTWQGGSHSNHQTWLSKSGQTSWLTLKLSDVSIVNEFKVLNTCNSPYNDRSTKGYTISVSADNVNWVQAATGTLQRCNPIQGAPLVIPNTGTQNGVLYVKFNMDSYYGSSGGLNYFQAFGGMVEDQVVEVTGDPHMRNLNGEVFDLSREGKHVLIQIPAGSGEKLEVIGTVTAFHKERKCPTFFMTQLKMKGSMVGEEGIQIVSDPENFGVKLGAATEFLNIDSTSSTAAGVAQVQRCNEDNMLCRSTSPGRRTPNYANKLLVQLPSSITIVASNYASANPSFMNLAVSGLAAQDDVGGLLGHGDHSMVAGEPECETSSRVQKISMLQLEDGTTVGHLML